MARYAQSLGVPQPVLVEENRAQSTLQNALFTLELNESFRRYIIVTEAFHLPRSWASFRWAAWQMNVPDTSFALVMSEDVRRQQPDELVNWAILFRESLAIWFNIGRAAAYSVAPDKNIDWLH